MQQDHIKDRPWRIATLAWWIVFLILGLFSEHTFHFMRDLGRVSRLNDAIGHPLVVTLAWSAFLGFFTAARCREGGLPRSDARIRGLEVCVLGGAAFFPFHLEALLFLHRIPVLTWQVGVVAIASIKLGAFLYLFFLLARYYASDEPRAFMPPVSGPLEEEPEIPNEDHPAPSEGRESSETLR